MCPKKDTFTIPRTFDPNKDMSALLKHTLFFQSRISLLLHNTGMQTIFLFKKTWYSSKVWDDYPFRAHDIPQEKNMFIRPHHLIIPPKQNIFSFSESLISNESRICLPLQNTWFPFKTEWFRTLDICLKYDISTLLDVSPKQDKVILPRNMNSFQ